MKNYTSVCDYLASARPSDPVICHRPHAARHSAIYFQDKFPGDVLYAVKANPSPLIIGELYAAGIRSFDVASIAEITLLSGYPGVSLHCMHPVKHPEHIRRAYHEFGVRSFALDSSDELEKICQVTANATDLALHVRIAVDNSASRIPLNGKFGVGFAEAPDLLVAARLRAARLGVCFHVGSQAMRPQNFARAIKWASQIIRKSGVILDYLNVGGGFPAAYPGIDSPPLDRYMEVIGQAFNTSLVSETGTLMCEPGRALVAESASILINVILRKNSMLYINDGSYGSMFDAAHMQFSYPTRALRDGRINQNELESPFSFYGPTCDSIDYMPGPFLLPADMRAGDYVEVGQMGAYADAMRTNFNGFGIRDQICVADAPMLSKYEPVPHCTYDILQSRTGTAADDNSTEQYLDNV